MYFGYIGLVSLLPWLQHSWGVVWYAPLGLEVVHLMQQGYGLQAVAPLPSTQDLLNAFNGLKLVWPFGLVEYLYLHHYFAPPYPMLTVPRKQ